MRDLSARCLFQFYNFHLVAMAKLKKTSTKRCHYMYAQPDFNKENLCPQDSGSGIPPSRRIGPPPFVAPESRSQGPCTCRIPDPSPCSWGRHPWDWGLAASPAFSERNRRSSVESIGSRERQECAKGPSASATDCREANLNCRNLRSRPRNPC